MDKIKVNEIRAKMVIQVNGVFYRVVSTAYNQNCQREPVVGLVLVNVINGNKKEITMGAHDFVFRTHVEEAEGTFISQVDDIYSIVDSAAYDVVEVSADKIMKKEYFIEGCSVTFVKSEDIGLLYVIPAQIIEVTVFYCTDSDKEKPAEITKYLTVKVPSYIKSGDVILINTETGDFVRRK